MYILSYSQISNLCNLPFDKYEFYAIEIGESDMSTFKVILSVAILAYTTFSYAPSFATEPDSDFEFASELLNCFQSDYEFSDLEYYSAGELKFGFCNCLDAYMQLKTDRAMAERCSNNMDKIQRILKKEYSVTIKDENCVAE